MVSERLVGEMVLLRGLGYMQKEISAKLNVSQSAVQYHLNRINEEARERGDVATYVAVLTDAFAPEVIEKIRAIDRVM